MHQNTARLRHFSGFHAAHHTFSLECTQQILSQQGTGIQQQVLYNARSGTRKAEVLHSCLSFVSRKKDEEAEHSESPSHLSPKDAGQGRAGQDTLFSWLASSMGGLSPWLVGCLSSTAERVYRTSDASLEEVPIVYSFFSFV